jgi:hypothetical protein
MRIALPVNADLENASWAAKEGADRSGAHEHVPVAHQPPQ